MNYVCYIFWIIQPPLLKVKLNHGHYFGYQNLQETLFYIHICIDLQSCISSTYPKSKLVPTWIISCGSVASNCLVDAIIWCPTILFLVYMSLNKKKTKVCHGFVCIQFLKPFPCHMCFSNHYYQIDRWACWNPLTEAKA